MATLFFTANLALRLSSLGLCMFHIRKGVTDTSSIHSGYCLEKLRRFSTRLVQYFVFNAVHGGQLLVKNNLERSVFFCHESDRNTFHSNSDDSRGTICLGSSKERSNQDHWLNLLHNVAVLLSVWVLNKAKTRLLPECFPQRSLPTEVQLRTGLTNVTHKFGCTLKLFLCSILPLFLPPSPVFWVELSSVWRCTTQRGWQEFTLFTTHGFAWPQMPSENKARESTVNSADVVNVFAETIHSVQAVRKKLVAKKQKNVSFFKKKVLQHYEAFHWGSIDGIQSRPRRPLSLLEYG